MEEFSYIIRVKLEWENTVEAEDMYQALDLIKSTFEQEHNLTLEDNEIISIEKWEKESE